MNPKVDWDLLLKYLQNTCNEAEKKQFIDWLNEDQSHRTFFDVVKLSWIETGDIHEYKEALKLAENNPKDFILKEENRKSKQAFLRLAIILLIIAAVFGFGLYFLFSKLSKTTTHMVDVRTDQNEKPHEILFSDGSKVFLNAGSRLVFPETFQEKYRDVTLIGEAFFEVTQNKSIPFRVHTCNTLITVIGTSFNVYCDSILQTVSVQVITGKVKFSSKKEELLLADNERAIYNAVTDSLKLALKPDLNIIAWKTGIIIFEDESLDVVLNFLSNYFKCDILLYKPELSRLKLSANYDNLSLAEILNEIELQLGVKFSKSGDVFTCYK